MHVKQGGTKACKPWRRVSREGAKAPNARNLANSIRNHKSCSEKNVFLKISLISQENACVGVSF